MRGTDYMMPQKQTNEAIYQQADPGYARYEGYQRDGARQNAERASYEQEMREESSKVYPLPQDRTNILRFTLTLIALGLLLLFGLLFVIGVGGPVGWASFAAACFALFTITGIGIASL